MSLVWPVDRTLWHAWSSVTGRNPWKRKQHSAAVLQLFLINSFIYNCLLSTASGRTSYTNFFLFWALFGKINNDANNYRQNILKSHPVWQFQLTKNSQGDVSFFTCSFFSWKNGKRKKKCQSVETGSQLETAKLPERSRFETCHITESWSWILSSLFPSFLTDPFWVLAKLVEFNPFFVCSLYGVT